MDSLVTPEQFASYLQRDLDRSTAELALAGASGLVRHYCRWVISQESTTFTADGTGAHLLSLPTLRLNAVDAVRVDGELLDASTYAWSHNGQLQLGYGGLWPRRFRAVEVDADHGYTETPDEICAVVLSLANRYYVNPEKLRSKTVGAISRTFVDGAAGDLTELETVLISGYRLP